MDFVVTYITATGETKRVKITVSSWEGETEVRSIFNECFPTGTWVSMSDGSRCSDARLGN